MIWDDPAPPLPTAPDGFFCRSLDVDAQRRDQAATFIAPAFVHGRPARRLWPVFQHAPHVPHLSLAPALRPEVAAAIARDLAQAAFAPHHHAAYRIDVCRRPAPGSVLGRFFTWLASAGAVTWIQALFGAPPSLRGLVPRQVQISRMVTGQGFAPHVDTLDDGVTVVFQFTRGYAAAHGGALAFVPAGTVPVIAVPPVFNTAFVFRPAGVRHTVTDVAADAPGPRYTITAFFLRPDPSNLDDK